METEVGMTEKIRAINLVGKQLGRTVRSIGIGAWQEDPDNREFYARKSDLEGPDEFA